jgi:hypothetical protein
MLPNVTSPGTFSSWGFLQESLPRILACHTASENSGNLQLVQGRRQGTTDRGNEHTGSFPMCGNGVYTVGHSISPFV